jgi:hypothetical protein
MNHDFSFVPVKSSQTSIRGSLRFTRPHALNLISPLLYCWLVTEIQLPNGNADENANSQYQNHYRFGNHLMG